VGERFISPGSHSRQGAVEGEVVEAAWEEAAEPGEDVSVEGGGDAEGWIGSVDGSYDDSGHALWGGGGEAHELADEPGHGNVMLVIGVLRVSQGGIALGGAAGSQEGVGADEAGGDEADVDVPGANFVPEGFGGAFEGEFGGAVGGHGGHGHHTADGGDIDDAALAFGPHSREDETDQLHGGPEVHIHLGEPLGFVDVLDYGPVSDASVIDESVDAAPGFEGLLNNLQSLAGVGYVKGADVVAGAFVDSGMFESGE